MNRAVVLAALLLAAPLPALGQGYSRDDDRGSSSDRDYDRKDDAKDGRRYDDRDRDGPRYHSGSMSRRGSWFHIKVGDATLNVKCDPQETMKACVDAALTLLDKARSSASGSSSGSSNAPSRP